MNKRNTAPKKIETPDQPPTTRKLFAVAAPNVNVTGMLVNFLSNPSEANPDVNATFSVALCGYGSQVPRVIGSGMIATAAFLNQTVTPNPGNEDTAGEFDVWLYSNDIIEPAGTYYVFTFNDDNGDAVQCNAYRFIGSGSFDLSALAPYDPNQPPPALPPLVTNLLMLVPFSPTPVFPGDTYTTWAITLSAEVTSSTLTGQVAGNLYTFIIAQNSTGGYPFAWPAAVINESSINPMPNSLTIQTFVCIANNGPLMAIGPATWWRP
jgi:hypothetical protein